MKTQLTAAPAFNYVGVKAKPNTAEQVTTNLNLNAKPAVEDTFELSAPQARSGVVPRWLLLPVSAVAAGLVSCAGEEAPRIAETVVPVATKAPKVVDKAIKCIETTIPADLATGAEEKIFTVLAAIQDGKEVPLGSVRAVIKSASPMEICEAVIRSSKEVGPETGGVLVEVRTKIGGNPISKETALTDRNVVVAEGDVEILSKAKVAELGLTEGINMMEDKSFLYVPISKPATSPSTNP
jgi:hypothetical protein